MAAPVWAHVYGLLCGVAAPCGRCGGPYRGRAAAPFAFTPAISPPPATATWDATDCARACMRWVHSSPRGLLPPVCTSHAAWGVSRGIAEGKETPRHRVTAGRAGGVRHVRGEAGGEVRAAGARVRVSGSGVFSLGSGVVLRVKVGTVTFLSLSALSRLRVSLG